MKLNFIAFLSILLIISSVLKGQEPTSISESRKKNIRSVLDYRFKGGYYSFERLFNKTVEYPEVAKQNCIMGIVVAGFEIDCKGEAVKVTLKNMLRFGIDEEISKFFIATKGHWNTCDDDKYTRFDIPIQFTLEGTETNTEDAMLIKEAKTIGFDCNDDQYYLDKANKYLEKGKGKKAIQNINVLIQRNPYNNKYIEMRKEALNLLK